jgi:flagellin-like hook-associated protein FlgL
MPEINADKNNVEAFSDRAINSMPRWAWGFLGTFIGIALTMQITGYNGSLNRIIEAHVKRIERTADNLEQSTSKLDSIVRRIEGVEGRLTVLETELKEIKSRQFETDKKYHK